MYGEGSGQKGFARYIKSICLLYSVTQKYFSEYSGQQRILEMPNTFRNNVQQLLESLMLGIQVAQQQMLLVAFGFSCGGSQFLVKKKKILFFSGVYITSVGSVWIIFLSSRSMYKHFKQVWYTVKCFHCLDDRFEHRFQSISRHLQQQSGYIAPEHILIHAIKAVYRVSKKRVSLTEVRCLFHGEQKSFDSFTSSLA